MAQKRELGYDAYDILPNTEQLADLLGDELGGEGELGYGTGELTDIPETLISQGKVTLGEDGVELEADTSLDTYVPNLDEHDVTHDLAFSTTDKDTVAWGSGTIYVGDTAGTTYAIDAGNTGNMVARTYIYLDTAVSTTVLQTSTSVSATAGPNKKLIAVAENGTAQASFTVYGGIGGIKLPGSSVPIENNNWTFSGAFSSSDLNTVAWGAGTLKTSDGQTYSISGGNTGNMAARTYIYFDLAVSTTVFQTTTTANNAVGPGKILIATAVNSTNDALFQVFGGRGGLLVDGDSLEDRTISASKIVAGTITANEIAATTITAAKIVAGTITANEIATGTITAAKMNVSQLSAIVADMGSITAGTVTVDTSGYIRGGQTAYDTGTGFFLGYSSGAYKFSIGNPSGNRLTWDGTSLTVIGTVANVQTFTSSGTWNKPNGGSMAFVQVWGGGGGGGYDADSADNGGGGGGGGYAERWIPLADLGSSETVTVGSGGAGGTSSVFAASGGTSSFGSHLTAYGGGPGGFSDSLDNCAGGGGGSSLATGTGGTSGGAGGGAGATSGGNGSTAPENAISGAGGGGCLGSSTTVTSGGNAYNGGAGGGASNGGTTSSGGSSKNGGDGGDGGGDAGSQPSGGGGGATSADGSSGGTGGAGKVVVTVI